MKSAEENFVAFGVGKKKQQRQKRCQASSSIRTLSNLRERIRGRRRAKSEREKLREWVTRCGVESDVSFPPNGGCLLSDGGNFSMGKCWRERERSEGESLCREREQCHLVLSIESRKFNANWSMDVDLVWRGNQLEDVLFSYWYFL